MRIRYRSLNEGEEIRTKLNPYRLFFSRRSWYVVGRSSLHRATRTFNLGRIAEIELLDDRYQIPRGFSIERFLRNAWHLIPEPGPRPGGGRPFQQDGRAERGRSHLAQNAAVDLQRRRHARFPASPSPA